MMMLREGDKGKCLSRRAFLIAGGQVFMTTVLLSRMGFLQIVEAEKYSLKADQNRISMRVLTPARGLIVDRNDSPLAINQQNFRVLIVSEQAKGQLKDTINTLAQLIPITENDHKKINRGIKRQRAFIPVLIRENLAWEDVAKIQLNAPDLPGITIDEALTRNYPYAEAFAHAVGYVAPVGEDEQSGDPILEQPGARMGKSGVELIHEKELRGIAGSKKVEINAHGRTIRDLDKKDGIEGKLVKTSLDMRLQKFAYERMKHESGCAIVMDVHTGNILSLVSTPSFDPNLFNWGLSEKDWNDLNNNIRTPLINKAVSGLYSPGSTFKMLVALAALESKEMTPETRVKCTGQIRLGNAKFHCWRHNGHGSSNMIEAIKNSCDIYFYEAAKRVGIDKIAEMAKKFGLGVPTGIDLPNEKIGIMPNREWKKKALNDVWHQGETLIAGIGQGYVLVTPLQLAVMTARIANGGYAVNPRIVPMSEEEAAKPKESLGISKQHLGIIQEGMYQVVNSDGATARGSRIKYKGMEMSGKTGTIQVKRISLREREEGLKKQEELPWEYRHHAAFVCFAPSDNPRYAISVLIEHGGSGSGVAAPIARDIMLELLKIEHGEGV